MPLFFEHYSDWNFLFEFTLTYFYLSYLVRFDESEAVRG
jgi:hypothetical protein